MLSNLKSWSSLLSISLCLSPLSLQTLPLDRLLDQSLSISRWQHTANTPTSEGESGDIREPTHCPETNEHDFDVLIYLLIFSKVVLWMMHIGECLLYDSEKSWYEETHFPLSQAPLMDIPSSSSSREAVC